MPEPVEERRRALGFTTIEMVTVLALFGLVLMSLVGLHLVALSAGTTAETSSIAANLARARMEELLTLPPGRLKEQNGSEVSHRIPPGQGRTYLVRTSVVAPDPTRLDLTVTVTWQLSYAAACASGPGNGCAGSQVTYARTLQTRVRAPSQAPSQP
jgi:Tfp pilus assembly protein PilV